MIIYNVTVNLEETIASEWVEWMKLKHIPDVMDTKFFSEFRFTKVLSDHGGDGVNYSIQYMCDSLEVLEEYNKVHAPRLQKEHMEKYGDKAVAFRTLLEVIN